MPFLRDVPGISKIKALECPTFSKRSIVFKRLFFRMSHPRQGVCKLSYPKTAMLRPRDTMVHRPTMLRPRDTTDLSRRWQQAYALTLRLRRLWYWSWYWYFCLGLSKNCTLDKGTL